MIELTQEVYSGYRTFYLTPAPVPCHHAELGPGIVWAGRTGGGITLVLVRFDRDDRELRPRESTNHTSWSSSLKFHYRIISLAELTLIPECLTC